MKGKGAFKYQQIHRPNDRSKKSSSVYNIIALFIVCLTLTYAIFLLQFSSSNKSEYSSPNKHEKASALEDQDKLRLVKSQFKTIAPESKADSRLKVAFAITITQDGFFQDGAAVLAYSIVNSLKGSNIKFSLIAFVHPSVNDSRSVLTKLGFHVIEAPTPINITAIQGDFLREKINNNGCCGASELIKLNSYRLVQYDRVVHLDADTMILNPINNLFSENVSLVYTTDPNMATFKKESGMPVQGGFLILKPSLEDYENLIEIVRTIEFYSGSGWNRSQIGWYWGGMTVQGLLPYYYYAVTEPGRSLKVDRCIYNTMADTEDCWDKKIEEVKTAHFTVCQKPWNCERGYVNDLCKQLHQRWFELRKLSEEFYGVPVNNNPCLRKYTPMTLEMAAFPKHNQYAADHSPDLFKPTKASGFITENYDNYVGGYLKAKKAREDAEKEKFKSEGQVSENTE